MRYNMLLVLLAVKGLSDKYTEAVGNFGNKLVSNLFVKYATMHDYYANYIQVESENIGKI